MTRAVAAATCQRITASEPVERGDFGAHVLFLSDDVLFVSRLGQPTDIPWRGYFFERSEGGWVESHVIERPCASWRDWILATPTGGGGRLWIGAGAGTPIGRIPVRCSCTSGGARAGPSCGR